MYVFVKKKFIDEENTNDPIHAFSLKCGWPDDINGKVFIQSANGLGGELIELHSSFPKGFFAKPEWCLTTDFIASVFVEHKIAVKLMEEREWDELSAIFDDVGLVWSSGDKCTEHTPTILKSRLLSEDKTDPISVHSSIYYGDRKLAVDVASFLPGKFKVMSYSEFIDYCYETYKTNYLVLARGCGKSLGVAKAVFDELADGEKIKPAGLEMESFEDGVSFRLTPLNDAFEEMRKNIHQGLVDSIMNQPYDIHISSDGKTTTAKFYVNGKVVREAEAKCHPEDRFNFHTGAEVAFDRLWEKKLKNLDVYHLTPGDKVRVRKDLKINKQYGSFIFVEGMDDFCGKIVTIETVEKYAGAYTIKEFCCKWTPEMFEEVTE